MSQDAGGERAGRPEVGRDAHRRDVRPSARRDAAPARRHDTTTDTTTTTDSTTRRRTRDAARPARRPRRRPVERARDLPRLRARRWPPHSIPRATTSGRSRSAVTAAGRCPRAIRAPGSPATTTVETLPVPADSAPATLGARRRRAADPPRPLRRGRHGPGPLRARGRRLRRSRRARLLACAWTRTSSRR